MHEQVREAHKGHRQSLMAKKGVIGTGIGHKIKAGVATGDEAVMVFVRKKQPMSLVAAPDQVPTTLAMTGYSVMTDVIEAGEVHALADRSSIRQRPIVGGLSIGPTNFLLAGTIGLPLVLKDGKRYLLTNRHVAGCDWLNAGPPQVMPGSDWDLQYNIRIGSRVRQPSLMDGGLSEEDAIGTVAAWADMGAALVNTMDAAIVELSVDAVPELMGLATYDHTEEAAIGMVAIKSGRTSSVTDGKVVALDVSIQIEYDRMGILNFENQIATEYMLDAGDSGSALLNKETGAVIGLGYAGSDSLSFHNPIGPVLKFFGVSLLTGPTKVLVAVGLASIMDSLVRVWSYEPPDGWKMFDPHLPGISDLTMLEPGRGYWLKVSGSCTLDYQGRVQRFPEAGWYLVGWV